MAIRIELSKIALEGAIEKAIQSCKRAANTARNPLLKDIHTKEERELAAALSTITEIK